MWHYIFKNEVNLNKPKSSSWCWKARIASFCDPLYLDINGSHLAIRIETAREIEVEIINPRTKNDLAKQK